MLAQLGGGCDARFRAYSTALTLPSKYIYKYSRHVLIHSLDKALRGLTAKAADYRVRELARIRQVFVPELGAHRYRYAAASTGTL
jgi:hypothetical protein